MSRIRTQGHSSLAARCARQNQPITQEGISMHRTNIIAAIIFGGFATFNCHREHPTHVAEAKFLVTQPLRRDTVLTKEYVAQIHAIRHVELRAIEKGYLQESFVDEGQPVAKGKKMFQIMPLIYQAEVQKASAEAQLTKLEYNNTKLLADKSIVSPNELALANAKVNKANADVALASAHRSLTEVRAPFNGMMGRLQVRLGSLVDEGGLLTTLSDNSVMWVYFNVSEAEYLRYKSLPEGQNARPVNLVLADGQTFSELGKVETIDADFNNTTGNKGPSPARRNREDLDDHTAAERVDDSAEGHLRHLGQEVRLRRGRKEHRACAANHGCA
jgi:membrane fusion protein, multidrug efflux system